VAAAQQLPTEDATLVLDGAFGSVKVGEVETGNGIIGRGYAGGAFIGSDGSVLAGASNQAIRWLHDTRIWWI